MVTTNYYYLTPGSRSGSCLLHRKECEVLSNSDDSTFLGSAYNWSHARAIVMQILKKSVEHCPSCIVPEPTNDDLITDREST